MTVADKRNRACAKLLAEVHAITAREGINPSALHALKLKLVALARHTELLFPSYLPIDSGEITTCSQIRATGRRAP